MAEAPQRTPPRAVWEPEIRMVSPALWQLNSGTHGCRVRTIPHGTVIYVPACTTELFAADSIEIDNTEMG